MKQIKKYTLEQFSKYVGRTHMSVGIHYVDGSMESVMNVSYSYIMYVIKSSNKEVSYIASL